MDAMQILWKMSMMLKTLCYEKDVKSTESVVGEIPDKDQFWIQMFELGRSIMTIKWIHVK